MDLTKPIHSIVRKEFDTSHYYWVNDKFKPAVTNILDIAGPIDYGLRMFLQNNTKEEADNIRDTAAEFGSKLHNAFDRLVGGEELDLVEEFKLSKEKKHLVSFCSWFKAFNPDEDSLVREHTVASVWGKDEEFGYAGTLDLACKRNGELWIIDYKTSKSIHYSHELQLLAYKKAFEEMYEMKVDHIAILRTGSQHKVGYEFREVTREIEEFMSVYETYISLNNGKIPEPPLIDVYPERLSLSMFKELPDES